MTAHPSSRPSRTIDDVASWVLMLVALFFAVLALALGVVFFSIDHAERLPSPPSPADIRRIEWRPGPDHVLSVDTAAPQVAAHP